MKRCNTMHILLCFHGLFAGNRECRFGNTDRQLLPSINVIHITPIPDLYEIGTVSLPFIIYLLHKRRFCCIVEATDHPATYAQIVLQCAPSQIHDYYFSLNFIQIHIFFSLDTNTHQVQKLFSIPGQQQIHKALVINSQLF